MEIAGWFPYLFLTKDRYHYVGPYPEAKFFDVDNMKEPERTQLLEWLQERQGETFDARQSLIDYCIQDCLLLMDGCMAYAAEYQAATGVYPYSNGTTAASTAMTVFRFELFIFLIISVQH